MRKSRQLKPRSKQSIVMSSQRKSLQLDLNLKSECGMGVPVAKQASHFVAPLKSMRLLQEKSVRDRLNHFITGK